MQGMQKAAPLILRLALILQIEKDYKIFKKRNL